MADEIFLIGNTSELIVGENPPTLKQILQNVMYNIKILKLSLHTSVVLAVENATNIWKKLELGTIRDDKIILKVEKAHSTWVQIFKNRFSSTDVQKNKRKQFREQLEKVFDVEFNDPNCKSVQTPKSFWPVATKHAMKSGTDIEPKSKSTRKATSFGK